MALVRAQPMSVRRAALVLGSLEIFGPISMDLYMPALPDLARDLHTSDALAQGSMSACMIGLGVGQLVVGPLSDRMGRRSPLIVGVGVFTLLSALCAMAPTIETLLLIRFAQGLAGSAGIVIAFAVARDLFDGAELSRLLSTLALTAALGPILAPVAGGQLVTVMDWRGIFLVLSGVGMVLLLIGVTQLPETLHTDHRHTGGLSTTARGFHAVLHERSVVAVLVVAVFGGIAFFTYLASISFVLQDEHGVSPQLFSVIFAANSVSSMLGAQTNRLFVRRAGPLTMYLAGTAGTAFSGFLLVFVVLAGFGLLPLLVALALLLSFNGITIPNGQTLILGPHGGRAGTAAAMFGTATYVVGPVVAPLVSAGGANGVSMSVTMLAGSLLAALIAWTFVRPEVIRRDKRATPSSPVG